MPKKYQDLLAKHIREGLNDVDELVDLYQFLLDSEMIQEMSPQIQQRAQYMIAEGFCYYIPDA